MFGKRIRVGVLVALVATAVATIIVYTQVTLFVIQPIGAVPEGRTLVISRGQNLQFIDSADAVCARLMGGVSLLCRGMAMAKIAENSTIYARLPYSDTLYQLSTGGASYDR